MSWSIIDKYLTENNFLVAHQIDSYNDFVYKQIPYIISVFNKQLEIVKMNSKKNKIDYRFKIYIGNKNSDEIFITKPIIDNRPLFPNECRLKNLYYSCDILCNIFIECHIYNNSQYANKPITKLLEKVKIANIPIMVKSKLCATYGQPEEILKEMGECIYDKGGYFIVDGHEKVIITKESNTTNRVFGDIMHKNNSYIINL